MNRVVGRKLASIWEILSRDAKNAIRGIFAFRGIYVDEEAFDKDD